MTALIHRLKTGKGSKVSVSLFDSSIATMTNQGAYILNLDVRQGRSGSKHPSITPYGDLVYTADGKGFLLACGTQQQFVTLCDILKLDLYKRNKFATNPDRMQNRTELMRELQMAIGRMASKDFEAACLRNKIPVGPINHLADVLKASNASSLIREVEVTPGRMARSLKTVVFSIKDSD